MYLRVVVLVILVGVLGSCSDESFSNFKSNETPLQVYSLQIRGDHPDNPTIKDSIIIKSIVTSTDVNKNIRIQLPYLDGNLFTPNLALTPNTFVKTKFPLDFTIDASGRKKAIELVISNGNIDVSYNVDYTRDTGKEIGITKFSLRKSDNPRVAALVNPEYLSAIDNQSGIILMELPESLRDKRMIPYIESDPTGVQLGNMPQGGYVFSSEVSVEFVPLNKVDKKTYTLRIKFQE